MDTDVEVYSPMKLTIQYLSLDAEDKIKTEIYFQYFEKISQSLLSTSECVVEVFFNTTSNYWIIFHSHFKFTGGIDKSSRESQVATIATFIFCFLEKSSWLHFREFSCCPKDSKDFQCINEKSSPSNWIRGIDLSKINSISLLQNLVFLFSINASLSYSKIFFWTTAERI